MRDSMLIKDTRVKVGGWWSLCDLIQKDLIIKVAMSSKMHQASNSKKNIICMLQT